MKIIRAISASLLSVLFLTLLASNGYAIVMEKSDDIDAGHIIAVDIGEYAKPNAALITLSLVLDKGPMPGHFTFTNTYNWPPGKYRVELYLNDRLTKTLDFTVEA